jgi:hypothetical protein
VKIHLVTANANSTAEQKFLVKAHTKAGAENFVSAKFKPTVTAIVPEQQDLVDALQSGIPIEDATTKKEPTP